MSSTIGLNNRLYYTDSSNCWMAKSISYIIEKDRHYINADVMAIFDNTMFKAM